MSQSDPVTASPDYGDSQHYDAHYFQWQDTNIDLKTQGKVSSFKPYVRPTDVLLDFGCAGGNLLAGLPAARRIGVEINDLARAAAIERFGIEAYRTLAEVEPGIVDVVITNHTLEHLASPYEALLQIRPTLKPGGKLVIIVPIDDWRGQKRGGAGGSNPPLFTVGARSLVGVRATPPALCSPGRPSILATCSTRPDMSSTTSR